MSRAVRTGWSAAAARGRADGAGESVPGVGERVGLAGESADGSGDLGEGGVRNTGSSGWVGPPHWFGAAGDRPVEILSLLGKQGERIHVRAAPRRKANNA